MPTTALTPEQLAAAGISPDWLDLLKRTIEEFDIAEPLMFLAQISHESAGLTRLTENLNYSATGLLTTFPKYFTQDQAAEYAHNPEAIANRVYANRMGNGDEASGDGWRYRGAGAIQLTGTANQVPCAARFRVAVDDIGDWLRTREGAVRSAGWFWKVRGCDIPDIVAQTKKINGGLIGLDARRALFERIQGA